MNMCKAGLIISLKKGTAKMALVGSCYEGHHCKWKGITAKGKLTAYCFVYPAHYPTANIISGAVKVSHQTISLVIQ